MPSILHVSGRDPDRDVAVFGYGVNPKIPLASRISSRAALTGLAITLSVIVHRGCNERTVYATRATVLDSNVAWTRVATPADDIVNLDFKGSTFYAFTHKNAPSYKLIATSLDAPNLAAAQVVIPAGKDVPRLGGRGRRALRLFATGRIWKVNSRCIRR